MRSVLGHRLAMMVLLLAALVVVPTADAILCASEGADAYAHVEAHGDEGSEAGAGADLGHGLCGHGHCHHAYAHVPVHPAAVVEPLAAIHQRPGSDVIASHPPDGLMRPPKA